MPHCLKWTNDPERANVIAAELCDTLDIVAEASGLSGRSDDPIVLQAATREPFIKIIIGEKSRVFDAADGDSDPIAWMESTAKAARRARRVR